MNLNKSLAIAMPVSMIYFTSIASAVPIGIIDSGTDVEHSMLVDHAWINTGEIKNDGIDNEQNGYVDDVHGWNFAEGNAEIIDYKYLGKFSPDTSKYFEVQL